MCKPLINLKIVVQYLIIKNCKFAITKLAIFQIQNTLYKYIKLSLLI